MSLNNSSNRLRCIAKNSLGETDGTIRLYELEAATEEEELNLGATERVAFGDGEGYVVADVDVNGQGDGYRGGEDPTEEEEREMAAGRGGAASDLGGQRGREIGIAGARDNSGRRRRKNRKKSRQSSSSSSRAENSHWNNGTCGRRSRNLLPDCFAHKSSLVIAV